MYVCILDRSVRITKFGIIGIVMKTILQTKRCACLYLKGRCHNIWSTIYNYNNIVMDWYIR